MTNQSESNGPMDNRLTCSIVKLTGQVSLEIKRVSELMLSQFVYSNGGSYLALNELVQYVEAAWESKRKLNQFCQIQRNRYVHSPTQLITATFDKEKHEKERQT